MPDALEPYKKLIEFVGEVCGPGCRLMLYDFSHGTAGARAVALVGYEADEMALGAPLTDMAKKIVADEAWKDTDYITNFRNESRDGRIFASSDYFIKKNGKLLGMICVNRDITKYKELGRELLRLSGLPVDEVLGKPMAAENGPYAENLSGTDEMVESVLKMRFAGLECPDPQRMTQRERMDVIKELESRGAFLVRGTVSASARRLGCSEASIYRYLAQVKK